MKKNIKILSLFGLVALLASCELSKPSNMDNSSNQMTDDSDKESTTSVISTQDENSSSEEEFVEQNAVSIIKSTNMVIGDTKTIKISYYPEEFTSTSIAWDSSDDSVVTVDNEGNVQAVGVGSATITVTVVTEDETFVDNCEVTVTESAGEVIEITDQNGEFSISTSDGNIVSNENIYTLTSAGTYSLTGKLEGQIVVAAGSDDAVTIELNGVTISYGENSPILATSADELTIKAIKNTTNSIYDTRSAKVQDVDDQGEGAISAKCDLKMAATGQLYVEGNYNNGVHTTKDLKIQKQTLKVKAVNNAIKGKDSVEILSGDVIAISTSGDGIETANSDLSSKNKQRGTITIGDEDNNPSVKVYSAGDAIQAAYNFEMINGTLDVYTASYSSYTKTTTSIDSYKGIKVKNELNINGGTLNINSYDDALHADYGDTLENGNKGVGIININGGSISTKVNSSSSRYVTGADAIHADNTLNINGGTIDINSAYEGLEANHIVINDGDITIKASDDGINAAKKINQTPSIVINGGKVDITMASGDTDGIDSNGSYTQTGGLVIVRGAPNSTNNMATGLDCDGAATLTGGTFIQLGARETVPSLTNAYTLNFGASSGGFGGRPGGFGGPGRPGSSSSTSSYTFGVGTWTISDLDLSFTVASGYSYYGLTVYSSLLTKGNSYTVSNGSTSYTTTAS